MAATAASTNLDRAIEAALGRVFDPCSLAANAPVSIVDMGLVLGWRVDEAGNVTVRMCVTSPCCTLAPNIAAGAERELRRIDGLAEVTVEMDAATFWTPDRMTDRGRETLRLRRERSQALLPVRPRQWQEGR
jgi:metal-sulfur cluster biosynthetic enzyme